MRISVIIFIFIVNFKDWMTAFVDCKIITNELCGPDTHIILDESGAKSSVTILLNPKEDFKTTCILNVTAPRSHVVSLQWYEGNTPLLNKHLTEYNPCPLSVYLPEDNETAVWKGDPCMKDGLPEIDLLTPQFGLLWTPPPYRINTRGRKLVVTAVAQGDACRTIGKHICMRIGWKPMLCISEQLVCDGNPNCPKGSSTSDEDEILCKSHLLQYTSWKQLANEVMKKLPSGIAQGDWLPKRTDGNTGSETQPPQISFMNWKDISMKDFKKSKQLEVTTTSSEQHSGENGESVSTALTNYGPWGYLMLGMLVCGTILMFCGLWECCFRKPKPQVDLQSQQPTTLLIINHTQDENMSHQPPNYDDLDQPPSYITLFPNFKLEALEAVPNDIVTISDEQNNTNETNVSVPSVSNEEESDSVEETAFHQLSNNAQTEALQDRQSTPRCIVTDL